MATEASPRQLFIHAGTHKTGSKSIQFLLGENARQILGMGTRVIVDHPSRGQGKTNCSAIANAFIRPELVTTQRIRTRFLTEYGSPDLIGCLVRQLNDPQRKNFILSCESFCFARTTGERDLLTRHLAEFGFKLIPIVYFREESSWRKSWTTHLKGKNWDVKQAEKRYLLDDWYFDRNAIADFWRSVSSDAVFVDYDEEMRTTGSVVPSFLRIVGLPQSLNAKDYFVHRTSYPEKAEQ